jgi:glycosyltransferase involved in cell wall biosynthesis
MNKSPLVSILIPTYNYAHYIGEAIESALKQTYTNFELIIVDDNSSDNTDEVIAGFLSDKRVSYFKNVVNLGLVGNFNKCLEYANGKYIKYLLADDKLDPAVLEKMVPIMESNPNISLITSYNAMFGIKTKTRVLPFKGLQDGKKVITECLKNGAGNWIGEPSVVMFRKSDLRVGKFSNKYTCLVDLEMWLRLLTVGDIFIIPEVLSYFRHHPKQASTKTNVQNWIDEYNFYKDAQTFNPYKLSEARFETLGLDKVIRDRAVHCSKGMLRIMHKLQNANNRKRIQKAFLIAAREKVIITGLVSTIKKHLHLKQVMIAKA